MIPFKNILQEQEENTDFEETFVHTVSPDEDDDLDIIEPDEEEDNNDDDDEGIGKIMFTIGRYLES